MIWSGDRGRWVLLACAFGVPCASAQEAPVAFDRPGIAFSTAALPAGRGSWEQGMPSITRTRRDGEHNRTWMLDTRWRVGLGQGVELQLTTTPQGGSRRCRADDCRTASAPGNTALGLKWAPRQQPAAWSYAVLLTHKVASGRAPIGDGGRADQLALSISLPVGTQAAWGGSIAVDRRADGHGWLASVNHSRAFGPRWSGYVELGMGTGVDHARVAGAGLAWRVAPRVQLDGWLLRGLDAASPDWQYGIGLSVALGRAR